MAGGQNIIVWSAYWQTCSRHLLNCAHSFHCYNLTGFVNLNLDGVEIFQITNLSDLLIIISKRSLATSGSTLDPWSPIAIGKRWDNDQSAVSQSTSNGRSHNSAVHTIIIVVFAKLVVIIMVFIIIMVIQQTPSMMSFVRDNNGGNLSDFDADKWWCCC